jgi:F5/8 type C domain
MKKIFIVAAVCALAAGCSQTEKLPVNATSADSRDIRLSVGVGDMQTRAGYTGDNLDAFQLIIDNKDNADYSCNLRMQKTDGAWNAADGASLTWNPAAPEVTVYAVAPAMDGVVPSESLVMDIPSDQSSEDVLKSADFLLAKKNVDFAATDGQIALSLEHKLSRLVISSTAEVNNVKVNGAILRGTCDLTAEAPSVTAASDAEVSSVTPLKNADGTYECILLPQSTSGMTVTYTKDGTDYEFRVADGQLEAGASYTASLKVAENKIIEIELDRSGWAVTGKFDEREWNTPSNFKHLFDGDVETYWTSDWNGPNACDQPVILVIDTKKEQTFSKVGIIHRAADFIHDCRLEFYVSSDEKTWWNFDHDAYWTGKTEGVERRDFDGWKTETNWSTQEGWEKVGGEVTMSNLPNPQIEYISLDDSKSGRYFIIKCPEGGRGLRDMLEFAEIYLYRNETVVE